MSKSTSPVPPSSAAPAPPRSYQRRLYDECITAGWDSAQQNSFAEEIAHLHEELSEAFRAYRQHKDFAIRAGENGKPEGIPIEFADVLIGLFYNAELHGFDLFDAVERKHQFNLTRDYNAEGRQLHPVLAAAPTDGSSAPQVEKCPACGHSPHPARGCLNIASDNDCDCGTQPVKPVAESTQIVVAILKLIDLNANFSLKWDCYTKGWQAEVGWLGIIENDKSLLGVLTATLAASEGSKKL